MQRVNVYSILTGAAIGNSYSEIKTATRAERNGTDG